MFKDFLLRNTNKYASEWFVLGIDLIVVGASFILAYLVRFNLTLDFDVAQLFVQLPIVLVLGAIAFFSTGSFKGIVRHTGIKDVYNLFNAICLASILTILLVVVNSKFFKIERLEVPLSIVIIHSLICFMVLTASRYVVKTVYVGLIKNFNTSKNIILYGAGESGIITHNTLVNHTASKIKIISYIDADPKKIGKNINGVPVFSEAVLTSEFIVHHNVSEIIITIHKEGSQKLRSIVESLVDLPVQVKIIPPVEDWINGELKHNQIKQVQIEDLLNRNQINIKNSKIGRELAGKKIMVTGGAGSIGSELVKQIALSDYNTLILIDQAESALHDVLLEIRDLGKSNTIGIVADIRDKNRMATIFSQHLPDIVFHAAAYKHVPLMQNNAYEAIKVNILGTKILADLSLTYQVDKFVFISTDKAVNPTNVMGASKRIAELYISTMSQDTTSTKFMTTRFGNVLGSNGSVIPLFKKQIERGGPLTVTHKEISRYFMTISEAAQLVLEAGAMGQGGEIFVFDMGESLKIYDLAKNMIKLSGLRYPEDIDIKFIGLRPGEKLFEELQGEGENTLPTYHKKIRITSGKSIDILETRNQINELCVKNIFQADDCLALMRKIVPEFKNDAHCREVTNDFLVRANYKNPKRILS